MKIVFLAVNSKYIHTSPSVRILNKIVNERYDSLFLECTIKEDIYSIFNKVKDFDLVFLSCYIWNIEIMIKLSKMMKEYNRNSLVIAGGPEVSYDKESFIDDFDYIMLGEGEETVIPLIEYIQNKNEEYPIGVVSKGHTENTPYYTKNLDNVPDIFDTYTNDDLLNRIIYVETSRGCPFNCSYCLSSVDSGVRFFSEDRINRIFDFIEHNKFKCIKFLDRTFNVNPKRFLELVKRLEKTDNTYQFEIAAELFSDEVINYFKNEVSINKFRLEIGIQSFNDNVIESVARKQDSMRLKRIIKEIEDSKRVTIHVDLIAGLPYETKESFTQSFNETFKLRTEELQLGFLKMLRGTKIRLEDKLFNYVYDSNPPYEVIENKFMSSNDIKEIHEVEESLEFMWNSKRSINLLNHLMDDNIIQNYYEFFKGYFKYYNKNLPLHDNYLSIVNYLKDLGIYNNDYLSDLKLDFLTKSRVKPMPFWRDKNKDNYLEKEYDYKVLGLSEDYNNSFITDYYDKYIVIKYQKNIEPKLEILKLNKVNKRHKSII